MSDDNVVQLIQPGSFSDPLTEVLRNGARSLLAKAVEAEVAAFLAKHADLKTDDGRSRLVRHGHLPEREVMTGIGPVAVRQPRVRDRGADAKDAGRIRFTSAILPPYARRSRSLEVLIPILYLKGVSTGARGASRQGCAGTVAVHDRQAEGDLDRGARSLEETRSVGPALRLCLGGWRSCAGSARG